VENVAHKLKEFGYDYGEFSQQFPQQFFALLPPQGPVIRRRLGQDI
jgi:hypothetical protein